MWTWLISDLPLAMKDVYIINKLWEQNKDLLSHAKTQETNKTCHTTEIVILSHTLAKGKQNPSKKKATIRNSGEQKVKL